MRKNRNLIPYAEAAQVLGVPISTLYTWVARRQIPHVRLSNRVVRFDRDVLESWLDESSVAPVENR